MRWQDISKILVGTGGIGVIGVIGLITYLVLLTGMTYTHSGDSNCSTIDGVYQCEAYINITTTYWNFEFEHLNEDQYIYLPSNLENFKGTLVKYRARDLPFEPVLYKKSTRGRKLWVNLNMVNNVIDTQPEVRVDWLVPARGHNWRFVKEGDTWDRGKNNRIKLIAYPDNHFTDIKWSFMIGDIDIDPKWKGLDLDYNIKDSFIDGKKAKEIKITNLDKDYNLKDLAEREKKDVKDYLNITKTLYYGNGVIKLLEKVNITKEIKIPYECNCRNESIIIPKEDSKFNITTTKIVEVCDTCYNYTEYVVEEFNEINPENYTLKNDVSIYEVFDESINLEELPNGSYGYSIWTDINILGNEIEGATWWNSSWSRKKPINISVVSGWTDLNYQIPINVTYDSDMVANFSGLRFQDSAESNLLDYWIEEQVNGSWVYAWVNISENITTTNLTIYMYYGNPTASSTSDGNSTFEFFDDFDATNIESSKWDTSSATGFSIVSGELKQDSDSQYYIKSQSSFSQPKTIQYKQKGVTDTTTYHGGGLYTGSINKVGYEEYDGADYLMWGNDQGKAPTGAWQWNEWKTVTYKANSTYVRVTAVGNNTDTDDIISQTVSSAYIRFGLRPDDYHTATAIVFYWDNVIVRKYSIIEPTYTFGAEEINDTTNPISSFGTNPVDNYNTTSQTLSFNLKGSDEIALDTLQLWGNWTGTWHANQTNSSPINDTIWNITVNGIPEGTWIWGVKCNDSFGNVDWTGSNKTITVSSSNITNCSTLNIAGTKYYLTANITNSSTSCCIDIVADNITLDCQGYTVDGNAAPASNYGICLTGINNTVIENCIISDWDNAAIYSVNSTSNNITDNSITESSSAGIDLLSSNSTTITNTNISTTNGVDAISIDNSSHIVITDCVISDDADTGSAGVWIDYDSNYVNVSSSTITGGWAAINIYGNDSHSRQIYIYNNFFNNTLNYVDDDANSYNAVGVYLNITQQAGTREYTSGDIGGNYWTDSDGNYSDTCADLDFDGFCDSSYTLSTGVTDYLPYGSRYQKTINITSPLNLSVNEVINATVIVNLTDSYRWMEWGNNYTYVCANAYNFTNDIGSVTNPSNMIGEYDDSYATIGKDAVLQSAGWDMTNFPGGVITEVYAVLWYTSTDKDLAVKLYTSSDNKTFTHRADIAEGPDTVFVAKDHRVYVHNATAEVVEWNSTSVGNFSVRLMNDDYAAADLVYLDAICLRIDNTTEIVDKRYERFTGTSFFKSETSVDGWYEYKVGGYESGDWTSEEFSFNVTNNAPTWDSLTYNTLNIVDTNQSISINVYDGYDVDTVSLEYNSANYTTTESGDTYTVDYNQTTTGSITNIIWMNDTVGLMNSTSFIYHGVDVNITYENSSEAYMIPNATGYSGMFPMEHQPPITIYYNDGNGSDIYVNVTINTTVDSCLDFYLYNETLSTDYDITSTAHHFDSSTDTHMVIETMSNNTNITIYGWCEFTSCTSGDSFIYDYWFDFYTV